MQIEKHISQLLFEHDCVIIPHFGGLVGNYRPAKLDKIQNKFSPPSKEISFNKNLTHNDGLLANRISIEEKISYEEANLTLKKYAEDLKISLQQGKKIELEQIGVLFADEQQNLRFEPEYSRNYRIDSYGLVSFHAPAFRKPELNYPSLREKTADIKFIDRPAIHDNRRITSSVRIKKYILYSAAVAPIFLLLLWLTFNAGKLNNFRDNTLNYSKLLPFIENASPLYTVREKMPASFSGLKDFDPFLEFPDTLAFSSFSLFEQDEPEFSEAKKIIVALDEKTEPKKSAMESGDGISKARGRFHIIGGCFQYLENAEKFMSQLRSKGFNPLIVDRHKGLYRISFQSFTSRKDALELLARVQSSSNDGAWMLVK